MPNFIPGVDPATIWAQVYGAGTPSSALKMASETPAPPAAQDPHPQNPSVAGAAASTANSAFPGIHNGNPANGYQEPSIGWEAAGAWSPEAQAAYMKNNAIPQGGLPPHVPGGGSVPQGEYKPPVLNERGYQSAEDAGLLMNEPQPGDPNYEAYYRANGMVGTPNWTPNQHGGGSINAGLGGYMSQNQLDAARAAPAQILPPINQGASPWVDPYGGQGVAAPTVPDIPGAGFPAGGANAMWRAPNANTGPGAPGQAAGGIRDAYGMPQFASGFGNAGGQQQTYASVMANLFPQTPTPQPQALDPMTQQPTIAAQQAYAQDPAKMAQAGAQPQVAATGFDPTTYPGRRDNRADWGAIDPNYRYPGGLTVSGPIDPNLILGIPDAGVRDLLLKYNDVLANYNTMLNSPSGGGFNTNQQAEIMSKMAWFNQNLPALGINVGGATPPAPGGGANSPFPAATRPGVDIGGGVPSISTNTLPAEITRMFGFKPGDNVSPEKITAAISAYMDMFRENRGAVQQQLSVNELDTLLNEVRNNPLRTGASERALSLADMGDPTDWEMIRNKGAAESAQQMDTLAQQVGASGARRGIGAGSTAGLYGNLARDQQSQFRDWLGDTRMQEAQSGYDYAQRGIDTLTNTFAATQNPMTQARMMLAQALQGEAPYGGQFGGGTNLFDAGSGISAIELLKRLDAGGSGWEDALGALSGLMSGAGGLMTGIGNL